jgi:hypothetical protein
MEPIQHPAARLAGTKDQPISPVTKRRSFVGRLWRAALFGFADGIPFVSQIVTMADNLRQDQPLPAGPRLVVGWSTCLLVAMMLAGRIWGQLEWGELLRLVAMLVAF